MGEQLGIEGQEAVALAAELAALTGESVEMAVLRTLRCEVEQRFRRFGRGQHPAKLDYRGCMAYALARSTGEPPLFKGDDFPKTDVIPALA